jgi:uncharacterized membrane protein YgcG
LTLIEILLALIVMVLGVIGILAVFPAAMESSKASVEETQGAIVANSVAHALDNAMNYAEWVAGSSSYDVYFTHDLKGGGVFVNYKFTLPKLQDPGATPVWDYHPGGTPALIDPQLETQFFSLAGDKWLDANVYNVHDKSDPSDPYRQFAFSFKVRKVNTLAYLIGQPNPDKPGTNYALADLEGLCRMYEYEVNVYRVSVQGGSSGGGGAASGGGGGGGGSAGTASWKLIATLGKRITLD